MSTSYYFTNHQFVFLKDILQRGEIFQPTDCTRRSIFFDRRLPRGAAICTTCRSVLISRHLLTRSGVRTRSHRSKAYRILAAIILPYCIRRCRQHSMGSIGIWMTRKFMAPLHLVSPEITLPPYDPCSRPLGMQSGAIQDDQITASSSSSTAPRARLHGPSSWTATTSDQNGWLAVNLRSLDTITRVATQGDPTSDRWVTSYTLQHRENQAKPWVIYKESGRRRVSSTARNNYRASVSSGEVAGSNPGPGLGRDAIGPLRT